MEANFSSVIEKLTEFLNREAKTETVVGEQFILGEFTCVPVVRVGMGLGSGGGEGDSSKNGKGHGLGAGVGMGIEPIGFLVTKGSEISFISTHQEKGISKMFDKVPDLLMSLIQKKDSEQAKN
ncbi:MAG TPA: GerW family sporulation protein [Lunatimonas sp.]|nr:GerW family sporulation protein [Lunatimonas sp.]